MVDATQALFSAIQTRNLNGVREALTNGARLENKDEEGETPLFRASLGGFSEILAEILRHEPNIEMRNEEGLTALVGASAIGRAEIVSQLLHAGALPDGTGPFPKETALMMAAIPLGTECLELLLEAGAEVDGQNDAGATALMTAVHWNNLDSVKLLTKTGASVDLRDAKGRTALFHAVVESRESICVELLRAGANPDVADNSGISLRKLASSSGSVTIHECFRKGGP